jgi:signal transduction histidine kinase
MRGPFSRPLTPLESREPIVSFAVIRALTAGAAVLALAILGFPYDGEATAVLAAVALPWSLGVLAITRRSSAAAESALIVVGDMAVLGVLQAVEPELYAPVHFTALFLVGTHAHFQGADRSLLVGLLPPAILTPVTFSTDVPVEDGLLQAYEVVFATASLSAALVVGALRTAESSGRLRARALSRRAIDTESGVRRQLAQAIHDGPIQELASVELMLASAEQSLDRGEEAAGRDALREARALTRSNISFLRDEILELGPHAFEELSFEQAVASCVPVWERRYGVTVETEIAPDVLPPEAAGTLFRITQEAVANAGKHAVATTVTLRLRVESACMVLEIEDDGRGFGDVDPLGPAEAGHIGLASMRERAEMLGGRLEIESGNGGTSVCVRIPL